MTDIVERLRDQGKDAFHQKYSLGMFKLCAEAADEIERLNRVLAESDALIATHANKIDSNPRTSWPKGSLLAAALDRHSARLLALALHNGGKAQP